MQSNIPYSIKRSRRARGLRIVVRCDAVVVTAPFRVSERLIHQFVNTRMEWIRNSLHTIQKKKKEWVTPEGVQSEKFHACQARAKKFIRDRIAHCNQAYQFQYARIAVKDMKTRWGSCSSQKNLNFHYRLLFLPIELADYVVVHELCHLQEMNHSKKFWQLVSKTIPDHLSRRRELKKYGLGM